MFREIKEVFTKEYREEIKRIEFENVMIKHIKPGVHTDDIETIEDKISRLYEAGYSSNCSVRTGSLK